MIKCQEDKELLLGKWVNYYNNSNYMIFEPDSFKVGLSGTFEMADNWEFKTPGVFYAQTDVDKLPWYYYYHFINNFMVVLTTKGEIIEIDEITLFTKSINDKLPPCKNSIIDISFIENNPGFYMICFPSLNRLNQGLVINEIRTVNVDTNFVETSIRMTSLDYVYRNFNFYFKGKKIPVIFKDELDNKNSIFNRIQKDELIVYIYGFNQIGRNAVNKMVNKKINGDILMLYFGSYKGLDIRPPYPAY